MIIISERDGDFDDAAVLAMVIAYERACTSLRSFGTAPTVQEIIAMRIIQVAKQGERDPDQLHQQALEALGIEEAPKVIAA
jgi:hypothetical protein